MSRDEPTQSQQIVEMFAEVIRRKARERRRSDSYMARVFDEYGTPHDRICEILDIDEPTLARLLADDGRHLDADCAFGKHALCIGVVALDDAFCECTCHGRARQQ